MLEKLHYHSRNSREIKGKYIYVKHSTTIENSHNPSNQRKLLLCKEKLSQQQRISVSLPDFN